MLDVIIDTLLDVLKLIPFLFITYLIMEFIEHKTSDKSKQAIKKSGKWGPLLGGILGIFPQCGFSVSATNFYATRVITLGTLIAVYLSTSDEMLPILISEAVDPVIILKILAIKLGIAIVVGFIIDLVIRLSKKEEEEEKIIDLCEKEHCDCDHKGIFKSSLKHTLNITAFILIVTFVINLLMYLIGEETIAGFLTSNSFFGPIVGCIIGLIPNCASSVILTQMYLEKLITPATMIAGLLVNAGVGLAVLFKINKGIKENIKIVVLLFSIGVIAGIALELIGLQL